MNSRNYDQQTMIHVAAGRGWFEVIGQLVAYNGDLSLRDRWGQTPLMCAIEARQELTARLLHVNGGTINMDWGLRILMKVSKTFFQAQFLSYTTVSKTMCHCNLSFYWRDLRQHMQPVSELVTRIAYPTSSKALPRISKEFQQDLISLSNPNAVKYIDFLQAAHEGDLEKLRVLVRSTHEGVDVEDYDKRTALHLAARRGHMLVVDFLINGCYCHVNLRDRWGKTPLEVVYEYQAFCFKSRARLLGNRDHS